MTPKAGAHGELCGMMAIKAALDGARREAHRSCWCRNRAHGTNPATAALLGYHGRDRAGARRRHASIAEAVEGALVARRRRDHADQPQHLRPVRARHRRRSPRRCTRPAPISTATAPTSTPSSARCGRAISASTPCTSTCTRPSRRRMAAAGRAPAGGAVGRARAVRAAAVRACADADGVASDRARGEAAARSRSAACAPSTARWACSCARSPTCCRHGARRHAAGVARMRCSTPTTSAPACSDLMIAPFGDRPCMHEALFDDHLLEGTGVTTLDFAKAMIDEGYPPDDDVFPAGRARRDADRADRSRNRRQSLDLFIDDAARSGHARPSAARRERFTGAPHLRAAPPPRRDARRAPAGAALDQASAARAAAE